MFGVLHAWLSYEDRAVAVRSSEIMNRTFGFLIFFFGNWMRDHVQQRNVLDDRRWGFLAETLRTAAPPPDLFPEAAAAKEKEILTQ